MPTPISLTINVEEAEKYINLRRFPLCPVKVAFNQAIHELHHQLPDMLVPYSLHNKIRDTCSWMKCEKAPNFLSDQGFYIAHSPVLDFIYATSDNTKPSSGNVVAFAGSERSAHESLVLGLVDPKRFLKNNGIKIEGKLQDPHISVVTKNNGPQRVNFNILCSHGLLHSLSR